MKNTLPDSLRGILPPTLEGAFIDGLGGLDSSAAMGLNENMRHQKQPDTLGKPTVLETIDPAVSIPSPRGDISRRKKTEKTNPDAGQPETNINGKSSVINDRRAAIVGVINDAKSGVPDWFRAYANRVRDVQRVRGYTTKAGAGAWWWRALDNGVRQYILRLVAGDECGKFIDCEWAALPEGLRTEISRKSRSLARQLEGCPWR